jgi:hypothetical protein
MNMNPHTWQKLLRTLQTRPQKMLRRNMRLDHLVKRATTEKQLQFIIDNYSKSEPIFLLLECFGKSCPLNRLRYPARRHQLIKKLHVTYIPKNSSITFISYGSGALLQDVIFLAHLIPLANPLHIDIHLIDPMLEPFDPTQSHEARLAHITQTERQLQFERWLKNTFPQLLSNISYHTNVYSYHQQVNHQQQGTFIGLAVDIDDIYDELQSLMKATGTWIVVTTNIPDQAMVYTP